MIRNCIGILVIVAAFLAIAGLFVASCVDVFFDLLAL